MQLLSTFAHVSVSVTITNHWGVKGMNIPQWSIWHTLLMLVLEFPSVLSNRMLVFCQHVVFALPHQAQHFPLNVTRSCVLLCFTYWCCCACSVFHPVHFYLPLSLCRETLSSKTATVSDRSKGANVDKGKDMRPQQCCSSMCCISVWEWLVSALEGSTVAMNLL